MERNKAYTLDIETNALLADMLDYSSFPYKLREDAKLWVVVITDVQTKQSKVARLGEITEQWMRDALSDAYVVIAHNGIKFDFITLKLFGVLDYSIGYFGQKDTLFGEEVIFVDTVILSRLLNPDRFGGHSLKAWGERLSNYKDDFRQKCIDAGVIEASSEPLAEFQVFSDIMEAYCKQDTVVNVDIYLSLLQEMKGHNWKNAIRIEHKLADLAVRRESLGFWFDKELALRCLDDLTEKMAELASKVEPHLPPKPMNKGELSSFTPPKNQLKKDGSLSANMVKFVERIGAKTEQVGEDWLLQFENKVFKVPFTEPVKTTTVATIDDLDHVKMTLMEKYGWVPTEWRERDLTKDSKKVYLPYEKRIEALERWYNDTMNGKYTEGRLRELGIRKESIVKVLSSKLNNDFPVRIPTSPMVRVGVEKELCPNLVLLGDKVSFAKDFALYLTYKHRKSSIAGGDLEDVDFDEEYPNTGFLASYREVDGRIPTPAIEIGASSTRYRHINVANIPRASSEYGKEMRSLFGAGDKGVQFGYDFSALESRVMGHYVINYKNGKELAEAMIAEKPNDIHTLNSIKLGIPRSEVKSLTYALLYGAQVPKIMKMLSLNKTEAEALYNNYWESVPALKQFKSNVEKFWNQNNKSFVPAIDGRKLVTRSKHSLLNTLFQSCGVIIAKYVNVFSMQYIEEQGYNIDVFKGEPDICEMIAYHDECQIFLAKKLFKYTVFDKKEKAEEFIKNYKGQGQLSTIGEGKKWYICLPNIMSTSVERAIKTTESLLKLNVPIGYEWIVGANWFQCH